MLLRRLTAVLFLLASTALAQPRPDAVRVELLDPDGKPAAGVPFADFFSPQPGKPVYSKDDLGEWPATDAAGRSDVPIKLLVNGNPPTPQPVAAYAIDERRGLVAFFELKPDQAGQTVTVRLQPTCRVRVAVGSTGLAQFGRHLTQENVMLYWGNYQPAHTVYSVPHVDFFLPPGTYKIRAGGGGQTESLVREFAVPADRRELDLPVDLRPDRLLSLFGCPAPEFQKIKGWKNSPPLTLASLRGKVVLIDFWGHWCYWCCKAMPELMAIHDKYKDRGVVVIGLHDDSAASVADMDSKLAKNRHEMWHDRDIPFPVALDGGGTTKIDGTDATAEGATTASYAITGYPTLLLIDRQGILVGQYSPDEKLVKKLDELLAAPSGK